MISTGTLSTFPFKNVACKGWVDQLPELLGRKDVLVAHPSKDFIAPARLLDREPEQTIGTLAVPDAFDLEHGTHAPFSAIASLLPSTRENLVNGR